MKKIIALLLCMALLVSVFVGCTRTKTTTETSPRTSVNEKDLIRIVLEDTLTTLNIHKRSAMLEHWGLEPINGFLLTYTEDLEIVPSLAESWNVESDTEIKFTLREAYFHNGKKVTSKDVKFTIEYVQNPETGAKLHTDVNLISEIKIISDTEFMLIMKEPYARIFEALTNFAIFCEESIDTMDTHPIGCGAFKFVEWEPNEYIKYEAFENYWDKGKPACDELVFYFIPEYNTSRTALLAGDVDIILYADPTDIKVLEGIEGITTYAKATLGSQWIAFNCSEPPFDNVLVRKAVNYAVDREGMIEPIYSGHGTVKFSYFDKTPYEVGYFKIKRDVGKAKELLTEAGYPNGITVKFEVPNTATERPLGELIIAQLAEAGINCELVVNDVAAFLEKTFQQKDFIIMLCGDTGAGDPDYPTYNYTVSTAPNAIMSWKNERYDELMNLGRAKYTFEERMSFYDEAFQILAEEIPWICLGGGKRTAAMSTEIEGFYMKPNLRYDFTGLRRKK
jgi:peptide/nickel transport system substrate-binding protein